MYAMQGCGRLLPTLCSHSFFVLCDAPRLVFNNYQALEAGSVADGVFSHYQQSCEKAVAQWPGDVTIAACLRFVKQAGAKASEAAHLMHLEAAVAKCFKEDGAFDYHAAVALSNDETLNPTVVLPETKNTMLVKIGTETISIVKTSLFEMATENAKILQFVGKHLDPTTCRQFECASACVISIHALETAMQQYKSTRVQQEDVVGVDPDGSLIKALVGASVEVDQTFKTWRISGVDVDPFFTKHQHEQCAEIASIKTAIVEVAVTAWQTEVGNNKYVNIFHSP